VNEHSRIIVDPARVLFRPWTARPALGACFMWARGPDLDSARLENRGKIQSLEIYWSAIYSICVPPFISTFSLGLALFHQFHLPWRKIRRSGSR
jgi:hypothetical protein